MAFEWTAPGKSPKGLSGMFPITLQATVAQVKTMADGGFRLMLDVGESDIVSVAKFLAMRGIVLELDVRESKYGRKQA